MNKTYVYIGLLIFALINFFLRSLPFLLFAGKDLPKSIHHLSDKLPAAIMVILVIYNLRNTSFTQAPFAIPEILAVLVTILVHYWKESAITSLILGTVTYIVCLAVF